MYFTLCMTQQICTKFNLDWRQTHTAHCVVKYLAIHLDCKHECRRESVNACMSLIMVKLHVGKVLKLCQALSAGVTF